MCLVTAYVGVPASFFLNPSTIKLFTLNNSVNRCFDIRIFFGPVYGRGKIQFNLLQH